MAFASAEIEMVWPYIRRSVELTIRCASAVPAAYVNWQPPAEHANSLYVLASHSMHNIEHRLLGVLLDTIPDRDRDAEFTTPGAADDLVARWATLSVEVTSALSGLDASVLDALHSHPERGMISGREMLLVAARHMAEHAGQAELTRDLLLAKLAS